LFILLLGIVRALKPKLINEHKAEAVFVTRHITNAMLCVRFFWKEAILLE